MIQTYAYNNSCVLENTAASAMRRGKNARNVAEEHTGKKLLTDFTYRRPSLRRKKTDDQILYCKRIV